MRREHGLEAAQVLLGHRQADVTQVYAERDLNKAISVAALVDWKLGRPRPAGSVVW